VVRNNFVVKETSLPLQRVSDLSWLAGAGECGPQSLLGRADEVIE
jgi:hypothetical protein